MQRHDLAISAILHLILITILTSLPNELHAQTGFVGGIVVDSISQEPLMGANIQLEGTTRGVISGEDGGFALEAVESGEHHLRATLIGYATQELPVHVPAGDSIRIRVNLAPREIHSDIIVVTGTRTLRSISDVPVRVEAIPAEEIEEKILMTPSSVAMLLNESTGMRVQTTSAASGTANLRIQGLDGGYTQLLNDGFPSLGGMASGLGLTQLAPLDLRQVEVLKGATSSLYGSDAIAGVVNFLPKRPGENPEINLLLNGTSQKGFDAAGFYSESISDAGISVLGSYNRQQRYDVDNDRFADVSEFTRLTLNPRAVYRFSEEVSGRLGFGHIHEHREGGAMDATPRPGSPSPPYREKTDSKRFELVSQLDWLPSAEESAAIKLAWLRAERDATYGVSPFDGRQMVYFADLQYSRELDIHDMLLGAGIRVDDFDDRTSAVLSARSYHFIVPSLFVQDEVRIVRDRLTLLAGARVDFHNVHGTFFVPRLSFSYHPVRHLTLRLGGGTGYKAPTIFVDEAEEAGFRNVRPIDDAGPTRARSASFDMNWRTIFDEVSLDCNAALFYTRLTDPLIADPDSLLSDIIFLRNASGPITATGGELSVRMIYGHLKLTLGYTYSYATQSDLGTFVEVDLNPRHSFGVVLVWEDHKEQLKMGLENYWSGKQRVEHNPFRTSTPSYWVSGFLAEKGFGNFRFYVNFENFLDTRQTRYEPIYTGDLQGGDITTLPIYAPLEGRVINAGVRFVLKDDDGH